MASSFKIVRLVIKHYIKQYMLPVPKQFTHAYLMQLSDWVIHANGKDLTTDIFTDILFIQHLTTEINNTFPRIMVW